MPEMNDDLGPSFRDKIEINEIPFSGDLLQRKEVARKLEKYVDRIKNGAVVCVDAPWGAGKSWFARNWHKGLKEQGHQVIFIDAFTQDYLEDPFLLIAAELLAQIPASPAKNSIRKAAHRLAKDLIPVSLKISATLAEKVFLGTEFVTPAAGELVQSAKDLGKDPLDHVVSDYLDKRGLQSKTLKTFREKLAEFATRQDKTVVFMVDELDRCKPDFSVRLIECIKHLFEVEKVLFVLFANRRQLEESVRGVYGLSSSASSYLDKYIDLFFSLPMDDGFGRGRVGFSRRFCHGILQKYKFPENYGEDEFEQDMAIWSDRFSLSLRDIKRAVALYVLSKRKGESSVFISYLIALKLRHPNVFKGILMDRTEAYRESLRLLTSRERVVNEGGEWGEPPPGSEILVSLHKLRVGEIESLDHGAERFVSRWRFHGVESHKMILNHFAKELDLSVS